MGGPAGAIIAAVVGAILAVGAAFGIVSSQIPRIVGTVVLHVTRRGRRH